MQECVARAVGVERGRDSGVDHAHHHACPGNVVGERGLLADGEVAPVGVELFDLVGGPGAGQRWTARHPPLIGAVGQWRRERRKGGRPQGWRRASCAAGERALHRCSRVREGLRRSGQCGALRRDQDADLGRTIELAPELRRDHQRSGENLIEVARLAVDAVEDLRQQRPLTHRECGAQRRSKLWISDRNLSCGLRLRRDARLRRCVRRGQAADRQANGDPRKQLPTQHLTAAPERASVYTEAPATQVLR